MPDKKTQLGNKVLLELMSEKIKLSIPKLTNLPKEELDEKKLEELTETFPKF